MGRHIEEATQRWRKQLLNDEKVAVKQLKKEADDYIRKKHH